ncbi:MAG: hypothetical protein JO257_37535 [Deltaproteobacteria bacterium]|nr:hypothetical protein [Deltaproteobacteria bacterium]
MRRVLWIVVLAACSSDPTLHVTVTHPAGSQVVKTVVSVYEGAFGCVDVEFGDLTHDQLQASLVAEETIAQGAAPVGNLDGISRADPKIVVARGYGSDGRLRTEGCAEKDLVQGADELALTTVMTATASVALADPTRADVFGLAVAATDADGKELDGRPVSWRVYAPVGAMPAATNNVTTSADSSWTPKAPTCTSKGLAVIHPVPPSTVGGYAIQARVAWAAEAVPLYSAVVADLSIAQLSPPAGVSRVCAIGRAAGIPKLVCLTGSGATSYDVAASGAPTASSTVPLVNPIGVYAVPSGSDAAVYAMDRSGVPTRVFPSTQTGNCGGCNVTLDDVLFLPACGSSPAKVLVHDTTAAAATQVKWMDPAGGALTNFPTALRTGEALSKLELESAGCASELDPAAGTYTTQQVAVIDLTRPATGVPIASRAHFACGTGMCQSLDMPIAGGAAGFSGGMQPYVIGTAIDATGVVLTSLLVVKDPSGSDHWVELARQPSASLPHRIASGQLDDDGSPDKVWDMKTKLGGLVEIAYARLVGNEPLAGLSLQLEQQEPPLVALDLLVGDVTGDGRDDIIVVGQTVDASKTGVAVAPSHAPAPIGMLKTDPTCAP